MSLVKHEWIPDTNHSVYGRCSCGAFSGGYYVTKSRWERHAKVVHEEFVGCDPDHNCCCGKAGCAQCDPAGYTIKLEEKLMKWREVLEFYADENNTVRDCVAGGCCANVDLTKKAKAALADRTDG
jgi:hypothetical protein